MHRIIDFYLRQWANDSRHKPLIIRGARQVGKTHAVRDLGKNFENFIEINFELTPKINEIFEQDLDPDRIIRAISLISGKNVIVGKTLLFFDEIQESPKAIMALRYFFEKMPGLHVIAAGSLLDFALEEISVPVGRVIFFYMHPMSFIEFLKALKQELLIEEIINHDIHETIPLVVHQKLLDYLGIYLAIGGMPEVVQCWLDTNQIQECQQIQYSLIAAYKQDFQKYAKKHQLKYINLMFDKIPILLGNHIKFTHFSNEYRKRELEPCLDLLRKANIVQKISHSSGNGIPLGAESSFDKFKLIFLDIALTQTILGIKLEDWFLNSTVEFVNKGSVTEAFIGQELLAYSHPMQQSELYYWHREERSSSAEVDYLIQAGESIIPIEAKSGSGSTLKSIKLFLQKHPNSPFGVRFSTHNYSVFDQIHSYPLYAVAGLVFSDKEAISTLLSA